MDSVTMAQGFFNLEQDLRTRIGAYLDPLGVNYVGFTYLMYINSHKGCRVSDVASAARMDKASVTRALAVLGRLGFVDREMGKMDARAFSLYLTPAGKTLVRGVKHLTQEWESDIREALGESDFEALSRLMHRAGEGLASNRAKSAVETVLKSREMAFFY